MKKLILSISLAISTIAVAQKKKTEVFYLNKNYEKVSEKEDWAYKMEITGFMGDSKTKIFGKNNQLSEELLMKLEKNTLYIIGKEYEKSHPNQSIVKLNFTEQGGIISDETNCYTMDEKLVKNAPCTDDVFITGSVIGNLLTEIRLNESKKPSPYTEEMVYNIRKWIAENIYTEELDIPEDKVKTYHLIVWIDEHKVPKLIQINNQDLENYPDKEEQKELKRVISTIPKQYLIENTTITIPLKING